MFRERNFFHDLRHGSLLTANEKNSLSDRRNCYIYMKQYGILIKIAKHLANITNLRTTCWLQNFGGLHLDKLRESNSC